MFFLFAQTSPEDVVQVIKTASGQSWEAALLALVMVAGGGLFAWVVKAWMNQAHERETRLSTRIDILEDYIRTELKALAVQCKEAVEKNTAAFQNLCETLDRQPCLWSQEKQEKMFLQCFEKAKT